MSKRQIYTVYSPPLHLEEDLTKDIRYIYLTTKTYGTYTETLKKANEYVDMWKNGEATAQSFGELAKSYSEDISNNAQGGIYKDVSKTDKKLPKPAIDWLFGGEAKPGDVTVVKGNEAYLVLYYEKDGT